MAQSIIGKRNAKKLLSIKDKPQAILKLHPYVKEAQKDFNNILNNFNLNGFFITTLDGINIGSSRFQNIGAKSILMKDKIFWKKLTSGKAAISSPLQTDIIVKNYENDDNDFKHRSIFAAAPIEIDGVIKAIFAIRLDPTEELYPIFDSARMGQTGETYIIDTKQVMLNSSRFLNDKYINLKTKASESLIKKQTRLSLQGYKDYRDVQVVGLWKWFDELNVGVITEIDYDEAFEKYQSYRNYLLAETIFLVILINVLFFILDRKHKALESKKDKIENQLGTIISSISGVFYQSVPNKNWTLKFVSPEVFNLTGLSSDELLNNEDMSLHQFIHEEDLMFVEDSIFNASIINQPYEVEYRIKDRLGNIKYVQERGKATCDEHGQIEYINGFIVDITEKHELENEIMTSQKKYSLLYENSPFGFAFCDFEGNLIEVNQQYLDIIGYSFDEAKKLSYWDITPKKYEKQEEEQILSLETTGRYGPYEKEYKTKTGELIPVELNGFVVKNYDGVDGIWSIVQDISERKDFEKQIAAEKSKSLQTAKLASLGEMAAGVAHEVNNPLAIMRLNTQVIERFIEKNPEKALKSAKVIDEAISRVAQIVKGLKRFASSSSQVKIEPTPINDIVKESINLCKIGLDRHNISLEVDCNAELEIPCNRIEIEQVLINLINNARDPARENVQEKWVKVETHQIQGGVEIRVIDSGKGINSETLESIYNPFYTTKEVGQGTGLGLSIALGIVEGHKGELEYELYNGNTSFVLRLWDQNENYSLCG